VTPYSDAGGVTVYRAGALDLLRFLPDDSVNLIATDPPFFRVKDDDWDNAWDSPAAYLAWLADLCAEWRRVLKRNGSLYVFASSEMSARVECIIGARFNVLNNIRWAKPHGRGNQAEKEALRAYFPDSESIIFAEHFGADNMAKGEAGYEAKCDELRGFVFEPLRAYLAGEWERAGLLPRHVNEATGTQMSSHYLTRSQWALPTEANYERLRTFANSRANGAGPVLTRPYEDLRRDYEDLRRDYEDLRRDYEDLRRPFNVTADVPFTDVWTFPTVAHYPGKHPCEKPLALMEHIVRTSSRSGDVVLDTFCGSGATAAAAKNLGRQAIVGDEAENWCRWTADRCSQEVLQLEAS
jgi:site-specific DNA-methyltransferase (adenine-specific)